MTRVDNIIPDSIIEDSVIIADNNIQDSFIIEDNIIGNNTISEDNITEDNTLPRHHVLLGQKKGNSWHLSSLEIPTTPFNSWVKQDSNRSHLEHWCSEAEHCVQSSNELIAWLVKLHQWCIAAQTTACR